jgi:Cdc6-like AAA superfamily ATPase
MRIFLTGAQGVGKSTLARELMKTLPEALGGKQFFLLDGTAGMMMKSRDEQLREHPDNRRFQEKITLYCLYWYVNTEYLISSRSWVDAMAYVRSSGRTDMVDMLKMYQPHLLEDDCLYFYVPIEFEISGEGNPHRVTSKEYQKQIDDLIKDELYKMKRPPKALPNSCLDSVYAVSGSVEDRARRVLEVVKRRGELLKQMKEYRALC